MKKVMCIIVALIFAVSFCACGESKNKGNNAAFDDTGDEFFDIGDDTGDTKNDSGESGTDVKKFGGGSNNTGDNGGDDNFTPVELYENKNFTPKSVPSRKNAYKLTNTMNKLKAGETLNVTYFGGSVTSGTGSTNASKNSWRALTTAFLKTLTGGKVEETNAGLGGTGSYLGAARFETSVLSNKPDLLFIEFAINDKYSGISAELCKMNLEYMINRLYKQNPNADIVLVLITNEECFGSTYAAYNAHKEVADYYNIPIVDLGIELYNKLSGLRTELKKVFSDSVHPNDQGYKLYADSMISALKELLVAGTTKAHATPATKLCANGFSSVKNVLASSVSATDWSLKWWGDNKTYEKETSQFRTSHDLKNIYPKYNAPNSVGSSMSYAFTGNSFGFIGTVKEGTTLTFTLDGGTTKTIKGVSTQTMIEYPVFENISKTNHTVTVTASGDGIYAAIAAFVVMS